MQKTFHKTEIVGVCQIPDVLSHLLRRPGLLTLSLMTNTMVSYRQQTRYSDQGKKRL